MITKMAYIMLVKHCQVFRHKKNNSINYSLYILIKGIVELYLPGAKYCSGNL